MMPWRDLRLVLDKMHSGLTTPDACPIQSRERSIIYRGRLLKRMSRLKCARITVSTPTSEPWWTSAYIFILLQVVGIYIYENFTLSIASGKFWNNCIYILISLNYSSEHSIGEMQVFSISQLTPDRTIYIFYSMSWWNSVICVNM